MSIDCRQDGAGMLAVSRAGHDKDNVYLILREEDGFVWLADGRSRTLEEPKKKNRKHIQIIKHKIEPFPQTDAEVKRGIKLFLERDKD